MNLLCYIRPTIHKSMRWDCLVRINVFYHPSHNHMATIVSTKIPQVRQLLWQALQKNITFI